MLISKQDWDFLSCGDPFWGDSAKVIEDLSGHYLGYFTGATLAGNSVPQKPKQPPGQSRVADQQGRCKSTWTGELKLPWREAGPPNHHDNKVYSDQ